MGKVDSISNRHADLLFEIVSRRYEAKSTLITTNRRFAEWGEVFPNAACVVSLVERLTRLTCAAVDDRWMSPAIGRGPLRAISFTPVCNGAMVVGPLTPPDDLQRPPAQAGSLRSSPELALSFTVKVARSPLQVSLSPGRGPG